MVRHKIVKRRINKIAKELKIFTTDDMYYRMNNHPNNKGVLYADRRRVTKNKLCAFLLMDKEVHIREKHTHGDNRTVWEYKEEEMADWSEEE